MNNVEEKATTEDGRPVHLQSYKELFEAIPKRIIGLVSKLISIKMFMFIIALLLFIFIDRFTQWALFASMVLVIFGREGLEIAKLFMGRK
jgi:hypothetical protein